MKKKILFSVILFLVLLVAGFSGGMEGYRAELEKSGLFAFSGDIKAELHETVLPLLPMDISSIVLDFRGNEGGNSRNGEAIIEALTGEGYIYWDSLINWRFLHLGRWYKAEKRPDRTGGLGLEKIYVLADENTGSAAEDTVHFLS